MTLRPELLRATPSHVALEGWCKHWQLETKECEVFKLSRPVTAIDVFLNLGMETMETMEIRDALCILHRKVVKLIQGIPGSFPHSFENL